MSALLDMECTPRTRQSNQRYEKVRSAEDDLVRFESVHIGEEHAHITAVLTFAFEATPTGAVTAVNHNPLERVFSARENTSGAIEAHDRVQTTKRLVPATFVNN